MTFKWTIDKYKRTDGTHALALRIIHNRKIAYYKPGVYIKPDEFNEKKQAFIGGSDRAMKLTRLLNKLKVQADDLVVELLGRKEYLTSKRVKMLLENKEVTGVVSYIRQTFLPRQRSYATKKKIESLLLHVERFDKDVTFAEVTHRWVERFIDWLSNDPDHPRTTNTVYSYASKLRTVINSAIKDEVASYHKHPFLNIPIKTFRGKKNYLTKEEVKVLSGYHTTDMEKKKWADFWLMMYYSMGARFGDALNFKREYIHGDVLTYRMIKTTESSEDAWMSVWISPQLKEIIDRYKSRGRSRIFPILDDKYDWEKDRDEFDKKKESWNAYGNKVLSTVCEELSLPKTSMHMARRSLANHMAQGGVNPRLIQQFLNHGTLRTTEGYLGKDIKGQMDVAKTVYL